MDPIFLTMEACLPQRNSLTFNCLPVGHAVLHRALQHRCSRLQRPRRLHEGLVQGLGPGSLPCQLLPEGHKQPQCLRGGRDRQQGTGARG